MASAASAGGTPSEHSTGAADSPQTPPAPPEAAAEEEHAELTTFQCRDAYVYRIPPASTIGHRAELWRVDDWDAVSCTPHAFLLRRNCLPLLRQRSCLRMLSCRL